MRGESPDVVIEFGELLARAPAHPAEAFVLRSDLGRVERLSIPNGFHFVYSAACSVRNASSSASRIITPPIPNQS